MDKELKILLDSVQEAGEVIVKLQTADLSIQTKSNNDIVTKGDLLVNEILKKSLINSFPDYGWLSEESSDDADRLSCPRVWIVDPIDGTREFAQGIPEYAISVALVEHNIPILSAVFNPAAKQLFYAQKNKGAWLNNKKLDCTGDLSQEILLLASRSEYKRGEWRKFEKYHKVEQVGSIAYKLALIASGYGQATFSLGPKNEWDVAAGVLLVLEANGIVTNKNREPLLFNQKEVKVNGIVATSASINDEIFSLIRDLGCHAGSLGES